MVAKPKKAKSPKAKAETTARPKTKAKAKAAPSAAAAGKRKGGGADRKIQQALWRALVEMAGDGRWPGPPRARPGIEDLAAQAGVDADRAKALYASIGGLLDARMDAVDAAMTAGWQAAAADSVRDRLFELLMRRFDALAADKTGIAQVLKAQPRDPLGALCRSARLARSMAAALKAAGKSTGGPVGLLRANGLMAIYLNALRVWIGDDSPDMGPTMAALDKGLAGAERVAGGWRSWVAQALKTPGTP